MYWFTADEHYGHKNVLRYCERPFLSIEEMDEELIARHNEVVGKNDTVIHAGDFTLFKDRQYVHQKYCMRLNGKHIYLEGSHDYWLKGWRPLQIWTKNIRNHYFVVCHYNMRVWPRSHYNSIHLFGHSHCGLNPMDKSFGKSWDIGVDCNNFYPYSEEDIIKIMKHRPDNFNLVKK